MTTNDARYWFRAKRYGWGWGLPLTWQGWVFIVTWMSIFPLALRFYVAGNHPMRWVFMATMFFIMLGVCFWKGDPAGRKWNSGNGN